MFKASFRCGAYRMGGIARIKPKGIQNPNRRLTNQRSKTWTEAILGEMDLKE
jgi:hypothetical protein